MSRHEYYEELGALAAIGQITAEEDKELDSHLSECSTCREAYTDYVRLLHQQLPQAEPRRWKFQEMVSGQPNNGELRERFFARARAEGIHLSDEAEQNGNSRPARLSRVFAPRFVLAGAALTLIVLGIVLGPGIRRSMVSRLAPKTDARAAELAKDNEALRQELAALNLTIESKLAEFAKLQHQSSASNEALQGVQQELAAVRLEAERLGATLQQAQQESTGLAGANQQQEKLLADLRAQMETLRLADADNLGTIVAQQARIRELAEALQTESAKVEREQQLTAVGQDVRKLMGARNLHIIDVHDVDGGGKSAKSFGRVFYAEGQSLIFYAFDLPNAKLTPAKYFFQAWGQRESASQVPRNLGTFQVDDHEQRRWVLKVGDSVLLRDIDAVFVTAETLGDAKEPRGKKLLYAYLSGQANHP